MATSTMEAEYIAAAGAAREALWLRKLLDAIGRGAVTPRILCDKQGAIKLAQNPGGTARRRHIDVVHHFVRDRMTRGELQLVIVGKTGMAADALTKPLASTALATCSDALGLYDILDDADGADSRVGVLSGR